MSTDVKPPPVLTATPWTFPVARAAHLSNGVRVLAYDCPGQHVIAATVFFDVPLTVEAKEIEGVAGLTGRCLTQGAAGRTSEEFADALALCGADLDASASPDGFAVRLSAPITHLGAGLKLMADAIRRPDFIESEFEHEKRLRLQEIDQARAYPQHVAVELLNAALFGDQRAARPIGGDAPTVEVITRADVHDFARRYFTPALATIIVAGDFASSDPLAEVEAAFGDWRGNVPAIDRLTAPTVSDRPTVLLVDWPDAPQATLRVAGAGVPRSDSRWPALFVANFAVGGTFSSRINTVLREQKGVTYGASSSLDTARGAGLMTVSTAVRTDATAEAVADIVTILREAGAGGLTDDEVATGVRAATESAPLGFERADAVAARVELLLAQGLPLDHVDANLANIRAVTREAADAAYRGVVSPDELTFVVVADAAAVEQRLREWGYADVVRTEPPGSSAAADDE
jgi:zinc protease